MSRKYIATLALIATLILVVGALVRRRALAADIQSATPPSEAAALQQLSQEAQMRRLAGFLSDRIAAVSPFVLWVEAINGAAVRWHGDDTVVSTDASRPMVALLAGRSDTIHAPAVRDADSTRQEWLLIVSRQRDGRVVSTTALSGGRSTVRCGERRLWEYVTGFELRPEFAGGGVFGIDGQLVGIIAQCGDRLIAVPSSDVVRLLADTDRVDPLRSRYGLELAPIGDRERAYFRSDSGLLVAAIWRGSAADNAGLRAGDVVLPIDSLPIGAAGDTLRVRRQRGNSTTTIVLVALPETTPSPTLGIGIGEAPARGVLISAVQRGSVAAAAGLREGDRLLRVGNTLVASRTLANRLLAAASGKPAFIVFERDSVERGVFLPQ